MLNWQSDLPYLVILMQVVVTFAVVPVISYLRFVAVAQKLADSADTVAQTVLAQYIRNSRFVFMPLTLACLAFGLTVFWQAYTSRNELFNWDNQAGLMVLFFVAIIPVLHLILQNKKLFAIMLQFTDSIRTASLKPVKWYQLMSRSLLWILVMAQVLLIATVFYFVMHPFKGFAGYTNLLGALVLNVVFIATLLTIYRNNKFGAIKHPEQRRVIKSKLLDVNLFVWIMALLNLSLTLWLSGMQWLEFKLLAQSLYLQFAIIMMAYTFTLPGSLINEHKQLSPSTAI